MTDVKRYDIHGCRSFCYGGYGMEESEYGDYVSYEDYAALLAQVERLTETRQVKDPDLGVIDVLAAYHSLRGRHVLALENLSAQAGAVRFAGHVLKAHRNEGYPGDVDGGYLQRRAVECGLLEERTVLGPCGEQCVCAEVLSEDEWPSQCFFNTEAGKAAMRTAEESSHG